MKAGTGNNGKCCFPIAAVSFGHGDNKTRYKRMISQKISDGYSTEHKLLSIRKGLCSAFLQ